MGVPICSAWSAAGGPQGGLAEQTHTRTALVAAVAERFGGEVPALTVTRPTLEEIYLQLIGANREEIAQ